MIVNQTAKTRGVCGNRSLASVRLSRNGLMDVSTQHVLHGRPPPMPVCWYQSAVSVDTRATKRDPLKHSSMPPVVMKTPTQSPAHRPADPVAVRVSDNELSLEGLSCLYYTLHSSNQSGSCYQPHPS